MSNQQEETPEIRRNRILGNAIGLSPDEVSSHVASVQPDDVGGFIVYLSIGTPRHVLEKIKGIDGRLYVHTGPIDFQGIPPAF